jgi:hypothetical protein
MKKRKVGEIFSSEPEEKVEEIKVDKIYYDNLIQAHVNLIKKLESQVDQIELEYLQRM